MLSYPISSQCPLSVPPENIGKPYGFQTFSGVEKGCIGNKYPNKYFCNFLIFFVYILKTSTPSIFFKTWYFLWEVFESHWNSIATFMNFYNRSLLNFLYKKDISKCYYSDILDENHLKLSQRLFKNLIIPFKNSFFMYLRIFLFILLKKIWPIIKSCFMLLLEDLLR